MSNEEAILRAIFADVTILTEIEDEIKRRARLCVERAANGGKKTQMKNRARESELTELLLWVRSQKA